MAAAVDPVEAAEVERLYECGERLSEAKDKSVNTSDYDEILSAAKGQSPKARQLAAQLIPRFFKHFPTLQERALSAMTDLLEVEELAIRIQAIRGFPLLGTNEKRTDYIIGLLVQLLTCDENVERDAVQKSLVSLIRQDVRSSLTSLFKQTEVENVREKVIFFLRDKVFPLKAEILKPQVEMEKFIADLIKKSSADVSGAEFSIFMDFLMTLSIFGHGASRETVQELLEMIEDQADVNSQFKVGDTDHLERLISCMYAAIPIYTKGASSSKFVNYFTKIILPVLDKFPEQKRVDLLKPFAASSPYSTAQDSRQILPSIVQQLKMIMPSKRTEDVNCDILECLLYTFHQLAYKTPNSTNSLCGYKIVTGQPSDRLGEDFSKHFKEFTDRLTTTEEAVQLKLKKITQGMAEHNKALSAAKTEEEKTQIKSNQQKSTLLLRSCNNILTMAKPLHAKSPEFLGEKRITLSWMEPVSAPLPAGGKRVQESANGAAATKVPVNKKGRFDGAAAQLANRPLSSGPRGGRGRGWGRNWGNRGRGRGRSYY